MRAFLADTTALLERTPAFLRVLLGGLPASWTDTPDTADGWRPRDVVGHLISAEIDNWMPRVRRILEDGPARPFDPFDRVAHVERDAGRSLDELLDRFAELRAANLAALGDLVSEADLPLEGRHPALGPVTLRELLATWAVHDLDHIAQVFAGLAGSHDSDVGPWKTNLGILLRRDDPAAVPG
jgi:hypothetical protein